MANGGAKAQTRYSDMDAGVPIDNLSASSCACFHNNVLKGERDKAGLLAVGNALEFQASTMGTDIWCSSLCLSPLFFSNK